MEYKTGQAVITGNGMAFIAKQTLQCETNWLIELWDNSVEIVSQLHFKPATEAEILAEAEKHGCVKKDYYEYNFNGFELYKSPFAGWVLLKYVPIETETLRQFCNDGLFVDRLITALNLANN